ncbi:hypothetical protein ASZ90_010144 [hydrocarbon metagenome]|uniref:Uncharacterized protein n=1 Tax=hydrocarbon metagenome TaxID=938273 RepID=A0A0W8FGZ0_9ZZZZ
MDRPFYYPGRKHPHPFRRTLPVLRLIFSMRDAIRSFFSRLLPMLQEPVCMCALGAGPPKRLPCSVCAPCIGQAFGLPAAMQGGSESCMPGFAVFGRRLPRHAGPAPLSPIRRMKKAYKG